MSMSLMEITRCLFKVLRNLFFKFVKIYNVLQKVFFELYAALNISQVFFKDSCNINFF
jgi:hypothetical protein